jgi:hypothetical protein
MAVVALITHTNKHVCVCVCVCMRVCESVRESTSTHGLEWVGDLVLS